jgi:hypothetical protein
VDDLEGDGVYYVFNGLGKATRVEIKGERAYVFANYGKEISLAALRSQRLNHMTALVISVEPTRANWWNWWTAQMEGKPSIVVGGNDMTAALRVMLQLWEALAETLLGAVPA